MSFLISMPRALIVMAAAAVTLGASAVTDWDVSYFPKTETGPWDWSTQDAWIRNWSPWAHTLLGSLPSYNESGVGHTANLDRNFALAKPGFTGHDKMFISRGNHEHWNPAHPKGEDWRTDQQRVKKAFPNDLVCAAKTINGVNFVAIDNGEGYEISFT